MIFDSISKAHRRRELAAPARQAVFARDKAWTAILQFSRAAWWVLLGAALIPVVAATPALYVYEGAARSFILGVALTTGVMFAAGFAILASGAAMPIMGLIGESWTAEDLKLLQRRGWRVVHGLRGRDVGDIDHVAVGPAAVLVVETKWSAGAWPLRWSGDPYMERQIDKARRQARRGQRLVRELLARAGLDFEITAVAVLWSPERNDPDLPSHAEVAGVVTVVGREFRQWLDTLPERHRDRESVDSAWRVLDEYARATEAGATRPRPTFLRVLTEWVVQPFVGFTASVYGLGIVAAATDNIGLILAAVFVFTAASVLITRHPRAHNVGLGSLVSIAAVAVLMVIATIRATV